MKLFSSLIPEFLKTRGLYSEAKAAYILEKMSQNIENNLGEEAKKNCIPKKFVNKKIYISVSNSSWRNEIFSRKKTFLQLIKKDMPEENFLDIVVI